MWDCHAMPTGKMWTLNRIVCSWNLIQGEEKLLTCLLRYVILLERGLSGGVCLCDGVFWWWLLWLFWLCVWGCFCFVVVSLSLVHLAFPSKLDHRQPLEMLVPASAHFSLGKSLGLGQSKVMCSTADVKLHCLGSQLFILSRTVCLLCLFSNTCNNFPALFNCNSECLPHPSRVHSPVCFLKGWKGIKMDVWCEMHSFTQAVL